MSYSRPQQIVIVRHGETEWSLSGQHTGRTDVALTPKGRHQAESLAETLSRRHFAAVWTSPLQRARNTCELAGFGGVAQDREDLMEWDYGDYEGLTTTEIRRNVPNWTVWRSAVPNGEDLESVRVRVDGLINDLRSIEGNCLLFAHGHILRALGARWINLDISSGEKLALEPAAICILGYEREQTTIASWNCSFV